MTRNDPRYATADPTECGPFDDPIHVAESVSRIVKDLHLHLKELSDALWASI